MAKGKKRRIVESLDELFNEDGDVHCRFCESCSHIDDVEGNCCEVDDEDSRVLLNIAGCDSGELISKVLTTLNELAEEDIRP